MLPEHAEEVITDVKYVRMATKNGNKTRQTDEKVERSQR